ncbi:basic phospholipase A2 PLA-B isoform X1 [Pogona vitticeps]
MTSRRKFILDMREFLLALILGASVFCAISSSLLNFKVMIERITKRNALIYYNGYGCYCGKGGRGKPRDRTDMCCFNHDCCYERLHQRKCHPYIDHYRYLIINGDVLCNYRNKSICSMLACECDEQAAYCFSQEAKSYNRKWRHYPGILCKEPTPKCPEEKNEQGNGSSSTNQSHQQESGGSQTRTNPAVILQLK